jgi:hypothetical protein
MRARLSAEPGKVERVMVRPTPRGGALYGDHRVGRNVSAEDMARFADRMASLRTELPSVDLIDAPMPESRRTGDECLSLTRSRHSHGPLTGHSALQLSRDRNPDPPRPRR